MTRGAVLGNRAGGPTVLEVLGKPLRRQPVTNMIRIKQSNQHIYVKHRSHVYDSVHIVVA